VVPQLNLGSSKTNVPPQMGKLNLKDLNSNKANDEEMKNESQPQKQTQAPQMKLGGGFSLDLSKAQRGAPQEDNRQDPTAEPDVKARAPIPSLKIGAVTEQVIAVEQSD